MAKQKMRETVLEQSKQENRNEEENCRRTGGFFDPSDRVQNLGAYFVGLNYDYMYVDITN